MTAVQNPSFEDAGEGPGEALGWRLVTVTSRERIAAFGPAPHDAWESFERWWPATPRMDVALAAAIFDPQPEALEDFEEAWANVPYLTELPAGRVVVASFAGQDTEELDVGWLEGDYATEWDELEAAAAPPEPFEAGWSGNEAYVRAWEQMLRVTARFDDGAEDYESFAGAWTPASTI